MKALNLLWPFAFTIAAAASDSDTDVTTANTDSAVVSSEAILQLPATLASQIDLYLQSEPSKVDRYYYLLNVVTGIHWRYSENGTSIVNDTYWNNAGNCLSWSLLTYAVAKRLNLYVVLQEVDIPPLWDRFLNTTYLGRHVNVLVGGVSPSEFRSDLVTIDFYPQEVKPHYRTHRITIERAMAMFYSNKGAEAMIGNDEDLADHYFSAAFKVDSTLDSVWLNYGTLLSRQKKWEQALLAFERAFHERENNIAALKQLVSLSKRMSLVDKQRRYEKLLKQQLENDPDYLRHRGQQYADNDKWKEALVWWKKADKIANFPEIKRDLIRAAVQLHDRDLALKKLEELEAMDIADSERQWLSKKREFLANK